MVSTVLVSSFLHAYLACVKIKRDLSFHFCLIEITNRHATPPAMAEIPPGATQEADNLRLSVYYAVIVTLKSELKTIKIHILRL